MRHSLITLSSLLLHTIYFYLKICTLVLGSTLVSQILTSKHKKPMDVTTKLYDLITADFE